LGCRSGGDLADLNCRVKLKFAAREETRSGVENSHTPTWREVDLKLGGGKGEKKGQGGSAGLKGKVQCGNYESGRLCVFRVRGRFAIWVRGCGGVGRGDVVRDDEASCQADTTPQRKETLRSNEGKERRAGE